MSHFNYPFSAIIGQQALKVALLISAIDPRMGGVLIAGPRGSAKSTMARSLADLIQGQVFVNLPLGASEEKLIGSLDLEKALNKNKVEFSEGLIGKAHQGVLYVDEVNLLADHLVDLLLDVAASGVNQIERDGISHQHAADFLLVGTMNPDEGELRPQLLDRFGLMVNLNNQYELSERQKIMQQRLSFDEQSERFCEQFSEKQNELKIKIESARKTLSSVNVADDVQKYITELCNAARVEGLRADITLYRASRAYAALHSQNEVSINDVDAVKEYVLLHRRNNASSQSNEKDTQQSKPSNSSPQNNNSSSSIQGSWGEMSADSIPVDETSTVPTLAGSVSLKKKPA